MFCFDLGFFFGHTNANVCSAPRVDRVVVGETLTLNPTNKLRKCEATHFWKSWCCQFSGMPGVRAAANQIYGGEAGLDGRGSACSWKRE